MVYFSIIGKMDSNLSVEDPLVTGGAAYTIFFEYKTPRYRHIIIPAKATNSKIKFIGYKKIKDRKLYNIITSEEDKFWKFISNKKYLNLERINLDKRLLKNYYLEKGFYKVQIQDAYSQLVDKNNFVLK